MDRNELRKKTIEAIGKQIDALDLSKNPNQSSENRDNILVLVEVLKLTM